MIIENWVQNLMLYWGLGVFIFSGLTEVRVLSQGQQALLTLVWISLGAVCMYIKQIKEAFISRHVSMCIEGNQAYYVHVSRQRKKLTLVDAGSICVDEGDESTSSLLWPKAWHSLPVALGFCGERVLIKPMEIPNVPKGKREALAEYETSFRYPWLQSDWLHGFYAQESPHTALHRGTMDVAAIFWHKKECMRFMEKTPWDKLSFRHIEPSLLALWRAARPVTTELSNPSTLVCACSEGLCSLLWVWNEVPRVYVTWPYSMDFVNDDVSALVSNIADYVHSSLRELLSSQGLNHIVVGAFPGGEVGTRLLLKQLTLLGVVNDDVVAVYAEQILAYHFPEHHQSLGAPHAVALGLILEEFHHVG